MTIYWRLQNIPELRGLPAARRRTLWREAASRSHTARSVFAIFLLFGLCIVGGDLIASQVGHTTNWSHSGFTIASAVFAVFINQYGLVQPRARQWLREHAGELDRYAPP